ncbi:hypothetical protein EXN66_Car008558 [Channa argus]|uniref:Uncharacterized protein n=1 Tax=Channa argus TaxID=215402 RepID=A0A6G1PRI5_CHAAH|nr:hypothetical protein EXN66_Car008558 [Channa argus]
MTTERSLFTQLKKKVIAEQETLGLVIKPSETDCFQLAAPQTETPQDSSLVDSNEWSQ